MCKVIKIFLTVVSSLVLAAIIIPVTVWLLLFLPPVQNFVVRQGSQYASGVLGTTVAFDRVQIRLFNAATFEGLYLEDYDRDTLLYVGKLSAGVDPLALFRREILLTDVRFAAGSIRMKRYEDGQTNVGQILERFRSENPARVKVHATSIEMRDMAFSYRGHDPLPKGKGMNFGDLSFTRVDMDASRLSVDGDSISVRLDGLSLSEKCGLRLNSLSSRSIIIASGGVHMGKTRLETPDTELNIERLCFDKAGEQGFADFLNDIHIDAEVRNSHIGAATVGHFIDGLPAIPGRVEGLSTAITGRPSDISGWLTASMLGSTKVSMLFAVRGLPEVENADFSVALDSLVTNGDDIRELVDALTGHPVTDTLSKHIDNLGNVVLKGNFTGRIHDFAARTDLRTAQGAGQANLSFKPSATNAGCTDFAGNLNVDGIEIGDLTGVESLGRLSVSANMDGWFGNGHFAAKTDAALSGLEYNGYDYHGIAFDGRISDRQFIGRIFSADPNLNFDFGGLLNFNDSIPRYDFALMLRNADLRKLNFNHRDSVSKVSFSARVAGRGNDLDDMNGEVAIDDMLYVNHVDTIRTGTITITGRNSADSKRLTLASDFADASFRSRMGYRDLGGYLTKVFYSYLPSLSGETCRVAPPDRGVPEVAEDFSVIEVRVKEANNVAGIFFPGLIIAKGSKITAMFNPDSERFSLSAGSDYIEMGESFISNLKVNGENLSDSLSLFVRAGEVYAGGFLLPDVSVVGGARENRINSFVSFGSGEQNREALIGTAIELGRDSLSGLPQARIRFTPSYYKQGEQQWNVSSRGIVATKERIDVDDFRIRGNGQELKISGIASAGTRDTLRVDVNNFDISPMSSLLNVGYQFSGRASGEAFLLSLLKSPILNARIDLDSMYVDDVKTPPLVFLSNWEADNSRVRMMLIEKGADNPVVTAMFLPNNKRVDGVLKIEGVDLSLLDTHYEGTISHTTGRADLNARIGGYGRKIKLNGTIDLHDYRATVDFLNVPYTASGVRIALRDNVIEGEAIELRDPEGNRAAMDMSIDLNKLNNVAYSFHIKPENILALNTTIDDNELFYGRVYASGSADIKGSKRGVNIDVTVSTSDNSRFYMPLSDKTDMREADFVRFVQPRRCPVADTTEYNIRKRMIMSREQRNRRIESSGNINSNIALTVRPNTLVELLIDPQTGHTVRGRGNGLLNLHVNPRNGEFTMYGDYQITEGVYMFTLENIIEKPFAIEPGSNIQWTGDPVDALLNISGVYRLKSSISAAVSNTGFENMRMRIPIECRIMLTDRLSLPTLTFNISAPGATPEVQNILSGFLNTQEMTATQFFFLLATGNFYDYEGNTGNIGAAAGSATAFDFLSNQFSNWISSDRFNIGIRYRPQTESTSDEWGIDLSQQLLGDRLLLEIEGSYDTRNNSEAYYSDKMKNFTGDFYLTGLIDRTGNLKTKLFSRTITRFDENQGLQEWGAGLYYTEDFNTFGDVLRNFKERFTGERRRKRLLLRQMEKEADAQADAENEEVAEDDETVAVDEAQEEAGEPPVFEENPEEME